MYDALRTLFRVLYIFDKASMHQNMQSESAFIVQSTICCVNKARLLRLSLVDADLFFLLMF